MTTLALIATKTQFELLPSGELGNEHEKPKSFFSVLIDQMQGFVLLLLRGAHILRLLT